MISFIIEIMKIWYMMVEWFFLMLKVIIKIWIVGLFSFIYLVLLFLEVILMFGFMGVFLDYVL